MTIEKIVNDTIEKNGLLKKGDHVIIGLSGGPDSVCLFFALLALKNELALSISAVHVNHMLRRGDAERDQQFVETLCRENGVACSSIVCDCVQVAKERRVTTEEAGRNIRYESYYKAAQKLIEEGTPACKIKIAVAQNKNDQAETMLMRIIRGTGVNGLSGIDYKRKGEHGTTIIRPLLDVDRAGVEEYCAGKKIVPCSDHTNNQPIYTRNKIRLELIPYITDRYNDNIIEALNRLSRSAKEDNEYLWEQAREAFERMRRRNGTAERAIGIDSSISLSRTELAKAEAAVRHRVIITAFQEIGLTQDISAAHLFLIDRILSGGNASAEVDLPGGYAMYVSYDDAIACFKNAVSMDNNVISARLDEKLISANEYNPEAIARSGNITAAFDYGRLKEAMGNSIEKISLRMRQGGDYFTPNGMKTGKKKVQDYFVDRKIPKEKREQYLVAALGNEVIWVLDAVSGKYSDISEKFKVTDETKEVLLLEIIQSS